MNRHPLLDLLVCPRTKSRLAYVELQGGAGLVSEQDGVLYPIINNIVIMNPAAPQIKEICHDFFRANENSISKLGREVNLPLTKEVLCSAPQGGQAEWHEREMAYWERRFENRLAGKEIGNPGWNRTWPRKKILDRLPPDLNKRVILEIGCGSSHTLFDVYGDNIPHYIGLDLSYFACRLTQRTFPNGLYVQASAETPPFKDNSIDVIIAYGVFHHLPGHENNILPLLPALKPGGYVIGADPLLKPRIPRPSLSKTRPPKPKDMEGSEEINLGSGLSPHNEWIDWPNFQHIISGQARVVESLFEYGPVRAVMVKFLYDKIGWQSLSFTKLMIWLDKLWLFTLGKLHPAIGPAAVHYAVQKL